ncbi:hypothetical protein Ahy_A06g026251 isoform G [Arachis hypogaea]|uniref:Uncharacterized protein n=1 Tax=Arachis hypogaea TaxID=3818 RepID=A0A445CJX0_ARAHY|nr:hypothetical protein Ahy_A06g026251 isoform G [Arachis hypogaea]
MFPLDTWRSASASTAPDSLCELLTSTTLCSRSF